MAIPNLLFLLGWVKTSWGVSAAFIFVTCGGFAVARLRNSCRWARVENLVLVIAVILVWVVLSGAGHFVYANSDWTVRDSVLLDLVRDPWPVIYDSTSGQPSLMLRAPIGFYLPAATIGKLVGIRGAELALALWTGVGLFLTFTLMLRDGPRPRQVLIRLGVFVLFSGMDIVGTITHYNPHGIGEHLEWWAFLFQYSSHTTQLFWVPNHALPGWIAIAWLLGYQGKRLPTASAILMVALTPLWSPLTAIGLAPIFGVAILAELMREWSWKSLAAVFDLRVVVPVLICCVLIYPYLLLGSETVASGRTSDVRWVGEDFVPRYFEFVIFEFALFAALLLWRYRLEPLLLCAIAVLLLLPLYRFGPANDLAMRASIPALALLAIRLGDWLSTPLVQTKDAGVRSIAVVLLAIGAVTPFMEIARVFIEPRWNMDTSHSLMDVSRGRAPHYLTPRDQPWANRFLRSPPQ